MTARAERVPAEEVRQRMLDAVRELAIEDGAALTIEHLRLGGGRPRGRGARSAGYRLCSYREVYMDELLCYLAGAGTLVGSRPVFDPETFSVASKVLADNRHLLATADGRRALLREVVRVTATRNYQALSESSPWRLHMALVATLGSTRSGEARQQIAAALEEAQLRSRQSMVALFDYLIGEIGLRLRDPEGGSPEHLQLAGGLLMQSLALRNLQVRAADGASEAAAVDALLNAPLPGPGLDGQAAEWTLVSHAYLGLVDAFVELDPDFTPPPLVG